METQRTFGADYLDPWFSNEKKEDFLHPGREFPKSEKSWRISALNVSDQEKSLKIELIQPVVPGK